MATFTIVGAGQEDKYCDDNALRDVINYITRGYQLPDNMIGAYGVTKNCAAIEMELVSRAYWKYSNCRLRHWVVSFSEEDNVTLEEVRQIADRSAAFYKSRYQIIYAIHTDTDNIHVHFVMNRISYRDGKAYSGKYSDYYDYRNHLSKLCGRYGVKLAVG